MKSRTRTLLTADGRNNKTKSTVNGRVRDDHDSRGRFSKGNKAATRRRDDIRKWISDAVSREDVRAITLRMVAAAKKGSVKASALLFGYLLGRPRMMDAPATVAINLGELTSLQACATASATVAQGLATGKLQMDEARALSEMVEHCRVGLEAAELEQRLAAVEERLGGHHA